MDNNRYSFGLAGFGLQSSHNFLVAPYKRIPLYPLISPAVDLFHSNHRQLKSSCSTCFPQIMPDHQDDYIDMLEIPSFGGRPWPLAPGVKTPSRWFADIRYTISTSIPHRYPSVHKEVMESRRVNAVVDVAQYSSETYSRASKYFTEIRAKLSKIICRICGYLLFKVKMLMLANIWILCSIEDISYRPRIYNLQILVIFKVFRRLMTKLLVNPQQMNQLITAEKSGIPLVYLPLHRSHLDYLLITWTAWHFGLQLPHIASGDNLNLSGLGWLLRATGAFFIRRRLNPNEEGGKDTLYRAVLHSYIEQMLKNGINIEFFLEGTRSRFGKPMMPKHGLISNVVEAVQQGIIPDCYLVPVSYTYDQVAEGVFLNELMGIPKVRESVLRVLRGVLKGFGISKRCGAVRIHYGRPILLTDYLDLMSENLTTLNSVPSQLGRLSHSYSYRELVPWHNEHKEKVDNRALIRAIGYHIVYEAQSMVSISLVSIISTLLLCKFRNGINKDILAADTQWLCEEILDDGGEIMGWKEMETCATNALEYALPYICSSVNYKDDYISPIHTHKELINIAYSKNALLPRFAVRSAIGLSIICRPQGPILFTEVLEDIYSICDWMQFEVIFYKPCNNLRDQIISSVERLQIGSLSSGLLKMESGDDGDGDNQDGLLNIRDSRDRNVLTFYSNLLRPFLQSLFIVIDHLLKDPSPAIESELIRHLCKQSLSNSKHFPFNLLLEAVNSDSFKNSLRILRHKGMLSGEEQVITILQISEMSVVQKNLQRVLSIF